MATIIGTKWEKNPGAKLDICQLVEIIKETPLAVYIRGMGKKCVCILSRVDFFDNFTLRGDCPDGGFETSVGIMFV